MTPHQEDKKSMYDTVLGIFDKYRDEIEKIPELMIAVANFRSTVALIAEHNEKAKTVKAGKYEAKVNSKYELISLLVPAINSLHSYARKSKLADLNKLTKGVTRASFTRLNKTEFDERVGTLYKALNDNKTNLSRFNVTVETVDGIKSAIDAFYAAEKLHLSSGSEKSAAHVSLEEAFDESDDILNEDIDGLFEHFRKDNSEFYNTYIAGRVIRDISGGKGKEVPPPDNPQQPQ